MDWELQEHNVASSCELECCNRLEYGAVARELTAEGSGIPVIVQESIGPWDLLQHLKTLGMSLAHLQPETLGLFGLISHLRQGFRQQAVM